MYENLQPHKLFRCRFATDVIKNVNNMEQAMGNTKLQHCCSCPELFIHCLGTVLSPSDSQTVGHKNHQQPTSPQLIGNPIQKT